MRFEHAHAGAAAAAARPFTLAEACARTAVIVPVLNAAADLPALLAALARAEPAPGRVLFIDSASDDGSVATLLGCGHRVFGIRRAQFGHGRTRNLGARLCPQAEFLVYLTQDACPQGTDWLAQLLAPFADPQVALAYGRQLPRAGAGPSERFARAFNYPELRDRSVLADVDRRGVKALFCSNSFAAYRRSALDAVGGFPERLPLGEDMAAALRLLQQGHARVYQPFAQAVHSHDYTPWQEFRRYFDIGALMRVDPELRRLRPAASGEGLRCLRGELSANTGWRTPLAPVGVLLRAAAKLLGYQLGKRHALLPRFWRRRLGMHRAYWSHP